VAGAAGPGTPIIVRFWITGGATVFGGTAAGAVEGGANSGSDESGAAGMLGFPAIGGALGTTEGARATTRGGAAVAAAGAAGFAISAGTLGFFTTNECPHLGHRILSPAAGTRRSSIWYGALQDSHSTFNIRASSRRDPVVSRHQEHRSEAITRAPHGFQALAPCRCAGHAPLRRVAGHAWQRPLEQTSRDQQSFRLGHVQAFVMF